MKKLILIVVFALAANFSFAQIQKGSLIGLHVVTVTLQPGATTEQLTDFCINKYIPAYENAFKGVKGFLIKARRGDNENKFGILWYFQTEADRDKFFTTDGMSDLGKAAAAKTAAIDKERDKLATVTDIFTDWIVQ